MTITEIIILSTLIFVASMLYSSVGHGGASGYLAAMALFGVSPLIMKPVGLVLNILVSSIASVRFYRAKCFTWSVFWPIALPAIPFAFLGGTIDVPSQSYKIIAGLILLFSAYRLFVANHQLETDIKPMRTPLAIMCGMGIGFLSGLIGVGGGIFLSPLLLFMNWATPRNTAGISAVFILVNSISGLLGHTASVQMLPDYLPYLAIAAIAGGLIGSKYGSTRFNKRLIKRILAVVLIIAGLKLIFT